MRRPAGGLAAFAETSVPTGEGDVSIDDADVWSRIVPICQNRGDVHIGGHAGLDARLDAAWSARTT